MHVRYSGMAALAAAGMLAGTTALAGPEQVTFPEAYQDKYTHYATVNRADERKQVVKMFANDVALTRAEDGPPMASGSVVVMEIYKAKLDDDEQPVEGEDGFFVPDELAAIAIMENGEGWGEEYPEEIRNGTWEYAIFKGDDHSLIERDYQPCFECHKPLDESAYMFSFDELKAAEGS